MRYTLHILLVTTLVTADHEIDRIKRQDDYFAERPGISFEESNSIFESQKLASTSQSRTPKDSQANHDNELNYLKNINVYRIPVITLDSSTIEKTNARDFDTENQYEGGARTSSGSNRLFKQATYEFGQKIINDENKVTNDNEILQGGYASSINSFQFNNKDGYVYEKPKVPFEEGPERVQPPNVPTSFQPAPPQKLPGYKPSETPAQSTTFRPAFQVPERPIVSPLVPSYRPSAPLPKPSFTDSRVPITQLPFSSPSSSRTNFTSLLQPQKKPEKQIPSKNIYEKSKEPISPNKPSRIPSQPNYVPVERTTQLSLYRPTAAPEKPIYQSPGIFSEPARFPVTQGPTKAPSIPGYQLSFKPQLPPSVDLPRIPQKPSYRPPAITSPQKPFNRPTAVPQTPSVQVPSYSFTERPQIITPQTPLLKPEPQNPQKIPLKPFQKPQQPSYRPPESPAPQPPFYRPTPSAQIPEILLPGTSYTPRPVTSTQKPISAKPVYKPSTIPAYKPLSGSTPSTGYIYGKPFVEAPGNIPNYRPITTPQPTNIQLPIQPIKKPTPQTPLSVPPGSTNSPISKPEQRPSLYQPSQIPSGPSYQIPGVLQPQQPQYKPSSAPQPSKTQFTQPPRLPQFSKPSQIPGYQPSSQKPLPIKSSTVVTTPQPPRYRPIQPNPSNFPQPQIKPSETSILQPSEPSAVQGFPIPSINLKPSPGISTSTPSNQFPTYKPQQPSYPSTQVEQRPIYSQNNEPLRPSPQVPFTSLPKDQTGYIYEKPKKPFIEISPVPSSSQKPILVPSISNYRPPQTSISQAPAYRPTSQSSSYRPPTTPAYQKPLYKPSVPQSPIIPPKRPTALPSYQSSQTFAPQLPPYSPTQIPVSQKPAYNPALPQTPSKISQKPSFVPSSPSYRPSQSPEYSQKPQIPDFSPSKFPTFPQPISIPSKPSLIPSIPSYQTPQPPSFQPPAYRPTPQIPSFTPQKPSLISSVQIPTPQPPPYSPTQRPGYRPSVGLTTQSPYKPSFTPLIQNIPPQGPSYRPPHIPTSKPTFIRPTAAPQTPLYQYPNYQSPSKPELQLPVYKPQPTSSQQNKIPQRPVSPILPPTSSGLPSVKPSSGYIYEKPKGPFLETQTKNPFELSKIPSYRPIQTSSPLQPSYRPTPQPQKPSYKPPSLEITKKPIILEPSFRPSLPSYQTPSKQPAEFPLKPVSKPPQITSQQTTLYPAKPQISVFTPSSFNEPSVSQLPLQTGIYRPSQPQSPFSNVYIIEKPKKPVIQNIETPSYKPNVISLQPANPPSSSFVTQGPSYPSRPTAQFPSYQFPTISSTRPTKTPSPQKVPQFSSYQPVKKPISPVSQKPFSFPIQSQPPINILPAVTTKPQLLTPNKISRPTTTPFISKPSSYPIITTATSKKPIYEAPGYIPPLIVSQNKPQINGLSTVKPYPEVTTSKPFTYTPKPAGPVLTTPKPFIYPSSSYRPSISFTTVKPSVQSINTQKSTTYVVKPSTNVPSTFKPFSSAPFTNKPYATVSTTIRPVSFESSTYKPSFSFTNTVHPSTYKPFTPQGSTYKPFTPQGSTYKPFTPQGSTQKPYIYVKPSQKPFTYGPSFKPIIPISTSKPSTNKPSIFVTPSYKPFVSQSTTEKPFTYVFPSQKLSTSKPFTYGPTFQPSVSTTPKPFTYGPSFQLSVSTTSKPFTYGPSFQPAVSTTSKPFTYSPSLQTSSSIPLRPSNYKPSSNNLSTRIPAQSPTTTPKPKFPTFSSLTPFTFKPSVTSTLRPSTTTEDRHYLPPKSDGYFYPKPNIDFDFK